MPHLRIFDWLKVSRAPFFLDVVLCACLGAAAAWYEAYYCQAGTLSWGAVAVSLPAGLLSSALLVINQIQDVAPDRQAGKMHLVARLGRRFGRGGYPALVLGAYASAGAGTRGRSPSCPPSRRISAPDVESGALTRAANAGLVRTMGANVACLLSSGALLCAGYLISGVLA